MATRRSALLVVALMSCVLIQSADALIHVVGGGCGWEVPPNSTFYADWAKPRTFGVGDKLGQFSPFSPSCLFLFFAPFLLGLAYARLGEI